MDRAIVVKKQRLPKPVAQAPKQQKQHQYPSVNTELNEAVVERLQARPLSQLSQAYERVMDYPQREQLQALLGFSIHV